MKASRKLKHLNVVVDIQLTEKELHKILAYIKSMKGGRKI